MATVSIPGTHNLEITNRPPTSTATVRVPANWTLEFLGDDKVQLWDEVVDQNVETASLWCKNETFADYQQRGQGPSRQPLTD